MLRALYQTRTPNRSVIIQRLKSSDLLVPDVLDFLRNHFNNNEPVSNGININGNRDDREYMDQVFLKCIEPNASLVAINAQNNRLIGVYLQEIHTRNTNVVDGCILTKFSNNKTYKLSALHEAYNNLAEKMKKDIDLFGRYPKTKRILEHSFICTHPEWAKEGVASRAFDFYKKHMLTELGCSVAYAICTSKYSARILEKYGYDELGRVTYHELSEKDKFLFNVKPPHDCITFKVKEMVL